MIGVFLQWTMRRIRYESLSLLTNEHDQNGCFSPFCAQILDLTPEGRMKRVYLCLSKSRLTRKHIQSRKSAANSQLKQIMVSSGFLRPSES